MMLAALALGSASCVLNAGGGDQVKPVWDLRNSRTMDDVGWPDGLDSDVYKADSPPGELRILLSEDLTIDGPFDVTASRSLENPASRQIEDLIVNYDREPLARAVERADELVARWGLDGARLAEWAERNAGGRDHGPGGPTGQTATLRLGTDGPTISMRGRALGDGQAYLTVYVAWSDPGQDAGRPGTGGGAGARG